MKKVYLVVGHFKPECTPQWQIHNMTWIEACCRTFEEAQNVRWSPFTDVQKTYSHISIEEFTVQ